jgi:hypothetical protein
MELYSTEQLLAREQAKLNHNVLAAIQRWWDTASKTITTQRKRIGRHEYTHILLLIAFELEPNADPKELMKLIHVYYHT